MEERFKTFTVLIAQIGRCIRRIKSEEMAEFQLKSHHVSCLYYLYCEEAMTATELCELCEEDKANLSRSIEYLEANGYLVSHPKAHRRYKTPLELTEKGREVGRILSQRIESVLQQTGEGVSEEERLVMYQTLATVSANLQRICDGYDAARQEADPQNPNIEN